MHKEYVEKEKGQRGCLGRRQKTIPGVYDLEALRKTHGVYRVM